MEPVYGLFLEAIRAALEDRQVDWDTGVTPEQMRQLITLAQEHHVLPMVFEAIHTCAAATAMDGTLFMQCKRNTVQSVMTQAMKSEDSGPEPASAAKRHNAAGGQGTDLPQSVSPAGLPFLRR